MRGVVIAILVALSIVPCLAQSESRVTLDLGSVSVYLGMPRQDVIDKCTAAGYKLLISRKDFVSFQDGSSEPFKMEFSDNRLVYADRQWFKDTSTGPFPSALAALGSVADRFKSPARCYLLHNRRHEPDIVRNSIFISCGQRSITLSEMRLANESGKAYYGVEEDIGEPLSSAK